MPIDIPKLNLLEISSYIADLLLISEGSEEAVRNPKVRFAWHLSFFSIIFFMFWVIIKRIILIQFFPNNPNVTAICRLFEIISIIYIITTIWFLCYRYYYYLLRIGKDLNFSNIIFFYFANSLLYSALYQIMYFIKPYLYNYPDHFIVPSSIFHNYGIDGVLSAIDFIIYSFCVSISINYPKISSASMIISIANISQVMFSIVMIALFVATFVQKADQIKKD
jgi:hypothetical protein